MKFIASPRHTKTLWDVDTQRPYGDVILHPCATRCCTKIEVNLVPNSFGLNFWRKRFLWAGFFCCMNIQTTNFPLASSFLETNCVHSKLFKL